jgi:TonB family protein
VSCPSNEASRFAELLTPRLAVALAASAALHGLLVAGPPFGPPWGEISISTSRASTPIRASLQRPPVSDRAVAHAVTPPQHARAGAMPRGPRYYTPRELDVKPGIMTRVVPEYPEAAAQRSLAGKVVVRLFIDESGAVERVLALRADPPGYFERSAEQAFGAARFSPGVKDGRAVKVQLTLEVNFDSPPPLPVRDRRVMD